jgi:hypothetical protein
MPHNKALYTPGTRPHSIDKERRHEISAHFRRHSEHEHPQRAGRPAGQTDRRRPRRLHSHRGLGELVRHAWRGMAIHHRSVRPAHLRAELVDFSIFPHVDHPALPDNTMAAAERWAAGIPGPAYAIDDQTAIKVVDDTVEVVSEGHWKLFTP